VSQRIVWHTDMPDTLMRQAWQQRRRNGWPATFEATMNDPVLARVVRIHAGLLERRSKPMPRYGTAHAARTPSARPTFDRKRAAAGEREDD